MNIYLTQKDRCFLQNCLEKAALVTSIERQALREPGEESRMATVDQQGLKIIKACKKWTLYDIDLENIERECRVLLNSIVTHLESLQEEKEEEEE